MAERPASRFVQRDSAALSATLEVMRQPSGQLVIRRYAATEAEPYWQRPGASVMCAVGMTQQEAGLLVSHLIRLLGATP